MREIKFRAWDGKQFITEDFYVQNGKAYILDDDGGCSDPECCGGTGYHMSEQDWKVIEFTGLKDKNDKEIYEGDIVNCCFSYGDGICEVVEKDGCYWVSQKNRLIEDRAFDNLFWHIEGIEVIGNIYETPHLIAEKAE